jgi:hypothetical protein
MIEGGPSAFMSHVVDQEREVSGGPNIATGRARALGAKLEGHAAKDHLSEGYVLAYVPSHHARLQ